MKLVLYLIDEIVNLSNEEKVNIIVIENQNYFTDILTDFSNQVNKLRGKCVLSYDNSPIDMYKNLEIITEFIPFDINKKPLVNKLLKIADFISQNEDFVLKTKSLYSYVSEYALSIAERIDYNIDFLYEFDVSAILKAINFKFMDEGMSISEKVIEYMLLVREFENDKCFVLVNFRNYLNNEEIDEFYKTVLYNKLRVLIISASDYPKSEYEKKIIVDTDLCQI